jgi:polysaccharide biosynthesis/export protein
MSRSGRSKAAALAALLASAALAACAMIPASGPQASAVAGQAQANGRVLFDVVPVDARVIAVLHAMPAPDFATRFKEYGKPPDIEIEVGDTLQVLLWQANGAGLLAPSGPPPSSPVPGPALPAPRLAPVFPPPVRAGALVPRIVPIAAIGSGAATLPDQPVEPDGTITVPYARRIVAAGRTAAELQQEIEVRLADKVLMPQALVIDVKSPANSVSVSGPVVKGGRIPLAPGGERLLQVIAAAGGARAPVRDVFVRLTRGAITATIPLATLVAEPAEDIYAAPGDILTLIEVPQTFAVFGAATRNAAIEFDADRVNLAEALAKSRGLNDNLANPNGVFVFRWERRSVVRTLGEPIAAGSPPGLAAVVYRFYLGDGKSQFLAREFPVEDKDVIFVADAATVPLKKVFEVVGTFVGPYTSAVLVCRSSRAKC